MFHVIFTINCDISLYINNFVFIIEASEVRTEVLNIISKKEFFKRFHRVRKITDSGRTVLR
jgi:hypothetical protein